MQKGGFREQRAGQSDKRFLSLVASSHYEARSLIYIFITPPNTYYKVESLGSGFEYQLSHLGI